MSRYFFDNYVSTPKSVKGGIKAKNQSGRFVKKWWGKRWIEVLESFHIGARLSRGRSYARQGQVTDLEISKGLVNAKVQGSYSSAYKVEIKLNAYSNEQWKGISETIAEHHSIVLKLISNEMPEEIEEIFNSVNFNLFPKKMNDLRTTCSCPDYSNPCKHIAAVFYLMAEAFDEDPFLLFKLRGIERNEFIGLFEDSFNECETKSNVIDEIDTDLFWSTNIKSEVILKNAQNIDTALIKRLGNIPYWRSEKDLKEVLINIYDKSAENTAQNIIEKYYL